MERPDVLKWLNEVWIEAIEYGWEPEHINSLILIGETILKNKWGPDDMDERLNSFSDYFEQWGVDSDQVELFANMCRDCLV